MDQLISDDDAIIPRGRIGLSVSPNNRVTPIGESVRRAHEEEYFAHSPGHSRESSHGSANGLSHSPIMSMFNYNQTNLFPSSYERNQNGAGNGGSMGGVNSTNASANSGAATSSSAAAPTGSDFWLNRNNSSTSSSSNSASAPGHGTAANTQGQRGGGGIGGAFSAALNAEMHSIEMSMNSNMRGGGLLGEGEYGGGRGWDIPDVAGGGGGGDLGSSGFEGFFPTTANNTAPGQRSLLQATNFTDAHRAATRADGSERYVSTSAPEMSGVLSELGSESGELEHASGEHPSGEHPSRTLFVRNINSMVEDVELRALFESHGDIRGMYTQCKHRGFVMISYYDIRDAKSAMRHLQGREVRKRRIDIHYSIPKDNPSEKDQNQGTLVVFNLDPSISNDELHRLFGVHGEIKEIRETPNKKHHKFIEFFDVRDADKAMKFLNKSDVRVKKIKIEPSRPGGARRLSSQDGSSAHSPPHEEEMLLSTLVPPARKGSKPISLSSSTSSAPFYSTMPLATSPASFSGGSYNSNSFLVNGSADGSEDLVRRPLYSRTGSLLDGVLGSYGGGHGDGMMLDDESSNATDDEVDEDMLREHRHLLMMAGGDMAGTSPTSNYFMPGVTRTTSGTAASLASLSAGNLSSQPPNLFGNGASLFPSPGSSGLAAPANSPSSAVFAVGSAGSAGSLSSGFSGFSGFATGPTLPATTRAAAAPPPSIASTPATPSPSPASSTLSSTSRSPGPSASLSASFRSVSTEDLAAGAPAGHALNSPMNSRSKKRDGGVDEAFAVNLQKLTAGDDTRTTVMIRNIPNKYNQKMLLAAVDEQFRGKYDFFYLPIDFKNKCNVGYSFINFINPVDICQFHTLFHNKKWELFNSEKVCAITFARIQGKQHLVSHFQNSSLMVEDKKCRPLIFHSDGPNIGEMEAFPVGPNVRMRRKESKDSKKTSASPKVAGARPRKDDL